jgi:hypothetical protein
VFQLCQGTPGFVRRIGSDEKWRQFKATTTSPVRPNEMRKSGKDGWVILRRAGWEFMVLQKHLEEGYPLKEKSRETYQHSHTFNRCILGRNGRGANRRRAMKSRRHNR